MKLTLNKWSALYILRTLRANPACRNRLFRRINIIAPDPSPLRRWSKNCFVATAHPIMEMLQGETLNIAVPTPNTRLSSRNTICTVRGPNMPRNAYIDIGDGIAISGPELLFVELASELRPIELIMLGHELCGSFGRNAKDPRNGDVAYDLPPLTSVERIKHFVEQASHIRGIKQARAALAHIADNSWSPTESIVAAFMAAPMDYLGYAFDALELNERVFRTQNLPGAKDSRVPDILVAGTHVGLNYDGLGHLDLEAIARAGIQLGMHPETSDSQTALERAMRDVRAKALDDARRNRELLAGGYTVFPVLKEDLYQPGGFDQLIARLVDVLEKESNLDLAKTKRALAAKALSADRYRLLRTLLPGSYEPDVQLGRYIAGLPVSTAPYTMADYWIEF